MLKNLNKERLYKQFNNPAKFLSIVIITYFVADTTSYIGQNYIPFNVIQTIINHSLVDNEDDAAQLYYDKEKIKSKEKDLHLVLIIGESARYDHFHINGYERETSPYLDKIPNLISYQNVTSCWNFTYYAVPCLLIKQDAEPTPPLHKGISFIDVFNHLNFESFWFGNQGSHYKLDQPYLKIAKSSKTLVLPFQNLLFNPNHDNILLSYLDENILESSTNKLIILHTKGSHMDYEERYPPEFRKYNPNCKTGLLQKGISHCTDEEIINSYDNTILYTDKFLSEVIKKFENKNALIIYISDHGESLGEEGVYLHGTSSRREQFHVPMFVWGSDKYIKTHQSNYKNLKSHYLEKLSYKNLFHTILGCANIDAPELIDDRLNLCS